jgi:predicted ATPase
MTGESGGETLEPERDGSNFAEWFTGLLSRYPSSYTSVERSLRQVMPDIKDLLNRPVSDNVKSLAVRFGKQNEDRARNAELSVRFKNLSDGEKCFFICAVILAANESYGPLFCFWDEPDSHLSLSEVGHFILSLRRAFGNSGQLLTTSHHPEAIRRFSDENTLLLFRRSHLEPTSVRRLDEISFDGDLVEALIRGDIPAYGD